MSKYVRCEFCTQLTKAYVAKTSCNQLLLIDWFCYVYAHQDLFTGYHNVAMSLYNISENWAKPVAWCHNSCCVFVQDLPFQGSLACQPLPSHCYFYVQLWRILCDCTIARILKISIKNFKECRNVRKGIEASGDISVATLTHHILWGSEVLNPLQSGPEFTPWDLGLIKILCDCTIIAMRR